MLKRKLIPLFIVSIMNTTACFSSENADVPHAPLAAAQCQRAIYITEDWTVFTISENGLCICTQNGFLIGPTKRTVSLEGILRPSLSLHWLMQPADILRELEREREVIFADYK